MAAVVKVGGDTVSTTTHNQLQKSHYEKSYMIEIHFFIELYNVIFKLIQHLTGFSNEYLIIVAKIDKI